MTTSSQSLCALEDATFADGRHGYVEGVNLDVGPGEIVMVTGPAGAGKSVVLRGAMGFCLPLAGASRLFGASLRALDHDALMAIRARTAYASEAAPLVSNLSIRDNIALPLLLRGMAKDDVASRVDRALQLLRLAPFASRRPFELSSMIERLALLARAWATPAELLVLDEPSRGLDDAQNTVVAELLAQRAREGTGILISIGDPTRWEHRAHRAIQLELHLR